METKQSRRYCFTLNNPFFKESDFVLWDKVSEIKYDYYNLSYVNDNLDLFEFHVVQVGNEEKKFVNRPFFKNFECFKTYIQRLEHFKYSIGQIERGEKENTEHIQFMIIFSIGKRFDTIKKYFPTAHIEQCKGSNAQNRDYCSKKETRVSDEFTFELGQFAEERGRTDISNFYELLKEDVSDSQLMNLYPSLYMREFNKIDKLRSKFRYDKAKSVLRDVEVTYLYGNAGVGKNRWVMKQFGLGNYFLTSTYGNGAFDEYDNEDVFVLDEFNSQVKIEYLNRLLDVYPVNLQCRFANKPASYTKVVILSNYPIESMYPEIKAEKPSIFKTFLRRVHKIYHMLDDGSIVIEKHRDPNILSTGQTKLPDNIFND